MKIAVVIPCFRTKNQILDVLKGIGPEVDKIYVVDDCCPEQTGQFVANSHQGPRQDSRVEVLFHNENCGVGGATITGYKKALRDGYDIAVKVDGDGQMDPRLISSFITPIKQGRADYTKGNRFFNPRFLKQMPLLRLIGNTALSFISKVSTGYWNIMDPTNGFTAIHTSLFRLLDLDLIERRYFFESDLLFRLNTISAVVIDVPMSSVYGHEKSGLKISKVLPEFFFKHYRNFVKRVIYKYFVRDLNIASVQLVAGKFAVMFGFIFGVYHWRQSVMTGTPATTGTVMVATLPIIVGFQLLLAALSYDMASTPKEPLHPFLLEKK